MPLPAVQSLVPVAEPLATSVLNTWLGAEGATAGEAWEQYEKRETRKAIWRKAAPFLLLSPLALFGVLWFLRGR